MSNNYHNFKVVKYKGCFEMAAMTIIWSEYICDSVGDKVKGIATIAVLVFFAYIHNLKKC